MHRLLLITVQLLLVGSARCLPKTRNYGGKPEAVAAAKELQSMNANQRKALWQAWKAENGKDYADGTPDDYVRFAAWSANLDAMIKSNQKQGGGHLHGLNPFSDLTFDEFKGQVLMPDQARAAVPATTGAPKFVPGGASSTRKLMQITPPATWDWRAKGKVPPIRNQGNCGSCWAFAGIGALEIKSQIDNVTAAPNASEQQMVDCITTSYGCGGGWSNHVFDYVSKTFAATEAAYPYKAANGVCRASTTTLAGALTVAPQPGFQWVGANATTIMQAVSSTGPVVVYFNVMDSFYSYSSGIYLASQCNANTINHVMIVVGYDATAGVGSPESYWIIRNSWGTWGEAGYVKVQMTNDNAGACAMYSGLMLPLTTANKGSSPSPSPSPAPKPCKGRKCL